MNLVQPGASDITGRTRILGILAHPTEHVKAPPAINRIARYRGRDAVMVPMNVAPADLARVIGALRVLESFDGAIVTVPHKQAILPLCDRVSARARAVGAANVLRREPDGQLVGDQLDGIGFLAGLTHAGITVSDKAVYLAGAGGAANAIAFALADAGVLRLTLYNRTREKIEVLRNKLFTTYPNLTVTLGNSNPSGHDLVVNATTLGMNPSDPLPFDALKLTPGMVVAEVVMEPEMTPLLAIAQAKGCSIHLGHPMLEHQLQLMADFLGL
ncbi:shikimate dehydrogenase [Rhizobium leguminosarum]|nr:MULTISPECIES: shikimate dehydrogenase [Rhizobium]MBY3185503.1 shikimate dehydrogenase [Rhizobium laguerreae]MBY3258636.1 shikimate dehydrogenase [Rhizobium laguerreae]MBY3286473.1 shikimate dehydrogenase [Rhizobium laguerreae]MBY3293136.1 shikimate dehydrogenase [Rhizobium laguerreae]MBY3300001.1 shikimate dehydrogenase [Rhizobium laguerreae]